MNKDIEADNKERLLKFQRILVEIAARVIQRQHLEHQSFSLPQQWKHEDDAALDTILCGAGIEIALEDAVTSAIVAEFNRLRTSSGWADGSDNLPRRYLLRAQCPYDDEDVDPEFDAGTTKKTSVDLVAWSLDADAKIDRDKPVVMIEAKRARRYVNRADCAFERGKTTQQSSVREDVEYLHQFVRRASNKAVGWVLLWGMTDTGDSESNDRNPLAFVDVINKDLSIENELEHKNMFTRWVPLIWDRPESGNLPVVTRWAWVAMAELKYNAEKAEPMYQK